MNNLLLHGMILAVIISLMCSVFSFLISLKVAKTLGQRLEREAILGDIARRYGEIREIGAKGVMRLESIDRRVKTYLVGTLPDQFHKAIRDANNVFLESFHKKYDSKKLSEVKGALDAIKGNMLRILEIVELKIHIMKTGTRV